MNQIGMKGREIDFIPDRLIEEPVVFNGLSDSEVVFIATAGILFWIPVSVLILLPVGFAIFGVGIGFGMGLATVLVAARYLQKLKRRMPDGLHIVYLKKMAQRKISFIDYGYIETSQTWDIRRERLIKKKKIELED